MTEQGSFKDLNAEGGYVSSFNLPPPDWNHDTLQGVKTLAEKESIACPSTTISEKIAEDDASRRTGDVAVYLYYVKAVGWLPALIFVVAISAFVFCMSFPSITSTSITVNS